MTTLTFAPIAFQSIEEYKNWRTEWKEQYKQLSADIRITKQAMRQSHRTYSFSEQKYADLRKVEDAARALFSQRHLANTGLELRQQSKVKASQLYILEHRVETNTEM